MTITAASQDDSQGNLLMKHYFSLELFKYPLSSLHLILAETFVSITNVYSISLKFKGGPKPYLGQNFFIGIPDDFCSFCEV